MASCERPGSNGPNTPLVSAVLENSEPAGLSGCGIHGGYVLVAISLFPHALRFEKWTREPSSVAQRFELLAEEIMSTFHKEEELFKVHSKAVLDT